MHKNIYAIVQPKKWQGHDIIFPDFPGVFAVCYDIKSIAHACTEALDTLFEGKSDEDIFALELKNLAQVLSDAEFLEERLKGAVVYCVEYYFDSRDIRK